MKGNPYSRLIANSIIFMFCKNIINELNEFTIPIINRKDASTSRILLSSYNKAAGTKKIKVPDIKVISIVRFVGDTTYNIGIAKNETKNINANNSFPAILFSAINYNS